MPRHFSLKTGCKINLYLQILKQRSDGFHLIESIFYPLARPADTIDLAETRGSGLVIRCCPPELESRQNILYKAFDLYAAATGFRPGIKLFLHKNIPVGAGLGGGSSNAAALLQTLNRIAGSARLTAHKLAALAAGIGADVPFFLCGRPSRIHGIGDIVSPCAVDLKGLMLVLICPGIHVDTSWAYRQWDLWRDSLGPQDLCLTSQSAKDKDFSFDEKLVLSNSFEKVIFKHFPEIGRIKTDMLINGAAACVMSGSGSSLAAFFRDRASACRACTILERQSIPFYFYNL